MNRRYFLSLPPAVVFARLDDLDHATLSYDSSGSVLGSPTRSELRPSILSESEREMFLVPTEPRPWCVMEGTWIDQFSDMSSALCAFANAVRHMEMIKSALDRGEPYAFEGRKKLRRINIITVAHEYAWGVSSLARLSKPISHSQLETIAGFDKDIDDYLLRFHPFQLNAASAEPSRASFEFGLRPEKGKKHWDCVVLAGSTLATEELPHQRIIDHIKSVASFASEETDFLEAKISSAIPLVFFDHWQCPS